MKYLFVLFLPLAFFSCRENSVNAQSQEVVLGSIDLKVPLRQIPEDKARDAPALILRMGTAAAEKNAEVCLPVAATGFQNLLAFQYTVRFDSAALQYAGVRKLNLAGYQENNFGTRFTDRGYLTTLWTAEDIVKGVSLPDATTLYEVCFTSLLGKGEETEVKFENGPTVFEVVGAGMERYRLVYANGKVTGK